MSDLDHMPRRCWAEIDLAALERNLKAIQAALPPGIRYIAVVKADAYGHGMNQTVARLMQAGVDMFAVANIGEAATIREIGGSGWPILILSATLFDEVPYLFEYNLIPTVSSLEEIERLEKEARKRSRGMKVHLKIDTGMGRLGVWHERSAPLFEAIALASRLELDGVYTHFASAESDLDFTELQRRRFAAALAKGPEFDPTQLLIHADNSAGINSFAKGSAYNAVRIGLLQFGVKPYTQSLFADVEVSPTFSFKTRVSLVKALPAGTDISYGRTCTLSRDTVVAVLSAGYGDGVPRALSNKGFALIKGKRCRYLGRVTMDQIVVDVTDLPQRPAAGDEACLIGRQLDEAITIESFSDWANTISWETLTSITKRVPRAYKTSMTTG